MKIDFDKIEATKLPEFKRGKGTMVAKMFADESVKILKGYLEPGSSIGMHTHEGSSETMFFLSGEGKAIVDDIEEILKPGSCSYCEEGHSHSVINTGKKKLEFYAVVSLK